MRSETSEVGIGGPRSRDAGASRAASSAARKLRLRKLAIEPLEERALMAVLPAVTPVGTLSQIRSSNPNTNNSAPTIVIDPINSQKLAAIWQVDVNNQTYSQFTQAATSSDGGQTWRVFYTSSAQFDPTKTDGSILTHTTDGSIAFDRNEQLYIVDRTHNPGNNLGFLNLHRFDFSGNTPSAFGGSVTVAAWNGTEAILQPTLAVDSNVPTYTDTTAPTAANPAGVTHTVTDPYSGDVYIAWVTGAAGVGGIPGDLQPKDIGTPLPNRVILVASSDGGQSFSPWRTVDDRQGLAKNAAPKLVISQGTFDQESGAPRVAPGLVTIAWDDFGSASTAGPPFDFLRSDSALGGVSAATFPATTGPIGDNAATDFPINVNVNDPNFSTLSNLSVSLRLTAPNLDQLTIQLVSPDGLRTATLATALPAGANMGAGYLPTTFDDRALVSINDGNAAAPYLGHFRPTFGNLSSIFAGMTPAQINGTWTLRIIDNTATSTPTQVLNSASLSLTSGMVTGPDRTITTTFVRGSIGGSSAPSNPTGSAATPNGIGPGLVLAADNTLGVFSPYQGRIYAAYVDNRTVQSGNPADNTDVFLSYSDDGGVTWQRTGRVNDDNANTDGFSEHGTDAFGTVIAGRPQFQPSIAVDQTTGTLVYSYRDARNDAARARVATYVTTSIDGGNSFAASNYLNPSKTATDAITGATVNQGPVPDNMSAGNPFRNTIYGYGDHDGLAVAGGVIYAAWASNIAFSGGVAYTGGRDGQGKENIALGIGHIAAGPRIISSTMGPVGLPGDTLNNQRTADGTPIVSAFIVTFDRPIDPDTFSTNDVSVFFRDTTPNNVSGGPVPVVSVVPLDRDNGLSGFGPARAQGATTFRINFAPRSAVGTYSYIVGPNVSDRIRTAQPASGGNLMDQNANATPGQAIADRYAVPTPTNGGGVLSPPYDLQTLPLIITGPVVASTRVPGNPVTGDNLVLNKTVSALDVTFDRDMNVGSFTAADVLRIQGPTGVIPGPYTVAAAYNQNGSIAITDNGTATSSLVVPNTGVPFTIADLNVQVNISHARDSELTLTLIAPDGTRVPLAANVGGTSGANFADTVFDDDAALPITAGAAPFNGSYRPATGSIDTALAGKDLTGTWRLEIKDNAAGNTGVLNSWSLAATPAANSVAYARVFRVSFPQQQLSGTYTMSLGSGILSRNGDAMDANQNAGVNLLRGTVTPGGTTVTQSYNSPNVPLPIIDSQTINSTIVVNDNYLIAGTTLTLSINHPSDPDLVAVLIAPDGTRVKLFTNLSQGTNFQTTTFDDNASTPIQNGGASYFGTYNPQQPLSQLVGKNVNGTWTLEITDTNANGVTGSLLSWNLKFQKPVNGSGLGETVADQTSASFRIFTLDPTNTLASSTWTAVGPASLNNGANSGNIGGMAIDPSDPSGNTAYIGAAAGGIWKTTNFLTTDPDGPTYIPLTSFGPTNALRIGSIAVFGRNNDPSQSIIFATTGFGDAGTGGVGFLRSTDGGATWQLLDSLNNVDASQALLPFASRAHDFVGKTSFKVAVDPILSPTGGVIVYAAFGGANGGIYRSLDTGNTWQLMRGGDATDLVLDLASGTGAPGGNLQIIYGAFRNDGVYISPNRGQVWNLMTGGIGNPLIRDADNGGANSVPVSNPLSTSPNGPFTGRISLARPMPTGNVVEDVQYQGWLYAVVSNPVGTPTLYLTKDFGQNWTPVRIPSFNNQGYSFPSNNGNLGNIATGIGDYAMSLAVDPTNPNVVYLGGATMFRIDTAKLNDAHALVAFDNGNPSDNGATVVGPETVGTVGGIALKDAINRGAPTPYYNLIRDPNNPFLANATILVNNVANFKNDGTDATFIPFDIGSLNFNQHRIMTFVDPVTGQSRLVIGDDQGVFTAVDNHGTFNTGIGNAATAFGSRNGNLQITQFYYGAAQPSNIAAQVADALFYAQAQDNNGTPSSSGDILQSGDLNWNGSSPQGSFSTGRVGDGTGVSTDQTGSGTSYRYDWPSTMTVPTNFFQVDVAPDGGGVGRTNGLIQSTGFPNLVNDGQWPNGGRLVGNFTVNPLNGKQIIISSGDGRIFSTENQGVFWSEIGNPAAFGGSYAPALAYGAPDPNSPGGIGNLDNFLYAGTVNGHIYVTQTGGGGNGNAWTDISSGLDGSTVRSILTNPNRGSHEAYAVTDAGVYHITDSVAAGATWTNITGNLFAITHNIFGDVSQSDTLLKSLTSLVADWRYVIPNSPGNPAAGTHPVLYAAGNGGVFRSIDQGATWTAFPDTGLNNTPSILGNGGGLPVTSVTDLDLSTGNIDPTTGRANVANGPNVLLATTAGSGAFAIRLAPIVFNEGANAPHLSITSPAPGGSDSGSSNTDNVTNVLRPVIEGLSAQTGFGQVVTVNLYDLTDPTNPVLVGTGITDVEGKFKIQVNAGVYLADGSTDGLKTLGVQAVDQAGTQGNIVSFQFTLDTIAPLAPGAPNLTAATDSPAAGDPAYVAGVTDTDNVTNFNAASAGKAPGFVITSVEPSTTVIFLLRNGTVVNQISGPGSLAGSVTITDPGPIPDGTYVYTATQTDGAGNTSPVSGSLTVKIDSTAPTAPSAPTLSPADNTGSLADNTTSVTRPHVTGTAEPNSTILLYNAANVLIGQAAVSPGGSYSVQPDAAHALPAGSSTLYVRSEDLAGNLSPQSGTLTLQILTAAPPASVLALSFSTDSGVKGDNITNFRKLQLIGSVPLTVDALRAVLVDSNGNAISDSVPVNSGSFTLTFAALENGQYNGDLPEGVYAVRAKVFDVANNATFSNVLTLTIDATGPSTPPTLFLNPADDTGAKGDGATSVRRPTLSGVADPGSTVNLLSVTPDGNGGYTNPVLRASGAANRQGKYNIQLPSDLVNGTIYLLASVFDAAGNAGTPSDVVKLTINTVLGDYDIDGKTDVTLYRPSQSLFIDYNTGVVQNSGATNNQAVAFQGDFDGDGKADIVTVNPLTDVWTIQRSGGGTLTLAVGDTVSNNPFLTASDIPAIGDFNGDGLSDVAAYRPTTGQWFIKFTDRSGASGYSFLVTNPVPNPAPAVPIPGDYNGDGVTDLATWATSTATWTINYLSLNLGDPTKPPTVGPAISTVIGEPNLDVPVPADYDGDGKTDVAIYRPTTGLWAIRNSSGIAPTLVQSGASGDIPAPADYNGDGKADRAVYRPGSSQWIIPYSGGGTFIKVMGSSSVDLPINAPYSYGLARVVAPASASGRSAAVSSFDLGGQAASFSAAPTAAPAAAPVVKAAVTAAAPVAPPAAPPAAAPAQSSAAPELTPAQRHHQLLVDRAAARRARRASILRGLAAKFHKA